MTEPDWLVSSDVMRMLRHVAGRASERKLRLFACAGCRRIWRCFPFDHCRRVVEVYEQYLDGHVGLAALQAAAQDAALTAEAAQRAQTPGWNAARTAAELVGEPLVAAERVAGLAAYDADLLRDIFGNPFRLTARQPAWLHWSNGILSKLARAALDARCLPAGTLEPTSLAILADALEEAGCDNADITGHLRGPGPHVLGCWVVDILLEQT